MKINQKIKWPQLDGPNHVQAMKMLNAEQELARTTAACMLWEDNFYEDGVSVAMRIRDLVPRCSTQFVASLAIALRNEAKLRHVPLLVAREMARDAGHKAKVAAVLAEIIQRPDELAEFVALYWTEPVATRPRTSVYDEVVVEAKMVKTPLAKQVKKGLALAFTKFNAFQLSKYNRDGAVKLRDVLFLCHAKPTSEKQAADWKDLINGTLPVAKTWETMLSAGQDKAQTFIDLMNEKSLGALAFLRNLRNMRDAGVGRASIASYAEALDLSKVLPFRFIAAARVVPEFEDILEPMLFASAKTLKPFSGKTLVLMDVSQSMSNVVSAKSDMTRLDAGCGVAMILRELCQEFAVASFSTRVVNVAPRRGFALRDAITQSQPHQSTYLAAAVRAVNTVGYDRIVVITDEESQDGISDPISGSKAYILNVASYSNGVARNSNWLTISGFSENVIRYIQEVENAVL